MTEDLSRVAREYPFRVLHVKASLDRKMGGSVTATLNAVDGTIRTAGQAGVAATWRPSDDFSLLETMPAGTHRHLSKRTWPGLFGLSLPFWVDIRRAVRRYDLLVLHEVFSFPVLAAAFWASRANVPYVIRPHGSLDPYDMQKHAKMKRLLRPLFRALLRGAHGLWYTAQRERERADTLGVNVTSYVTTLPVPAVICSGDRDRFRTSLNIDDDEFVFLFLGRIDRKKGLVRTIEAFSRAQFSRPARLVIAGVGDPSFEREVSAAVHRSACREKILMPGFLRDEARSDAFVGSDLFVLHSDNENFGLAPVEALQFGLPSLLSNEVFIGPELRDLGVAMLVEASDIDSLIVAMELLVDNSTFLKEARNRSAEAFACFEPDRVAQSDQTVILDVLNSPRKKV